MGIITQLQESSREDAKKAIFHQLDEKAIEQLDELSKTTLGNYINKSHIQASRSDFINGRLADKKPTDSNLEYRIALSDKSDKRTNGIRKAVDKLTKEDTEQVQE